MLERIKAQIEASCAVKQRMLADSELLGRLAGVVDVCADALRRGNKILLAGNGGSAADAQHIAAEFVGRFQVERRPLSAIALTTDTSLLTSVGNDYGFDAVFERQIYALGQAGDVFIGITTSGNSANVLKAMVACQQSRVTRVGLTGERGGEVAALCDYLLNVPAGDTPRIQEAHILVGHLICELVDDRLFGAAAAPARNLE